MKMFYHIWSEFAFSTLLSYAVKQHERFFCQTKFCGPCYRRCWTKLSFLIVASLSPMEKNKPLHPRCKLHVHVFHLKLFVSNCPAMELHSFDVQTLLKLLNCCSWVSTVPPQPDKLFSNPEKLKGLSKSVPSFLQEEASSISDVL